MSIKRVLSVLVIAALFSFFVGLDSGYAADRPDGAEADESKTQTEKKIGDKERKGSIYDAIAFLTSEGVYEGNATSRINFRDESGINPDTRVPYSLATIHREIQSLIEVEVVEEGGNRDIYLKAGINHDVLDAANKEIEKIIPRKEKGTGKALGLRRFNLADLGPDKLKAIANIIEQANLKNQAKVNIVAFEGEFAQRHGQVLLNIVKELREDQIPVIINATGGKLNLIRDLEARVTAGEIHVEDVRPDSVAAIQFREMFSNQKYVGLEGDLDRLKKAIVEGKVKI